MRNFQTRKRLRQHLYSKPVAVVLVVIAILLGKSLWELFGKYQVARENRAAALAELGSFKDRNANLQQKIKRLKTERGVEEEIRKNFTVVKEGEQMITVVDEGSTTSTATSTGPSWWQKFFNKRD